MTCTPFPRAILIRVGGPPSQHDADACLRLQPRYAKARFAKGRALYFLGEYEAAFAQYDAGLRLERHPKIEQWLSAERRKPEYSAQPGPIAMLSRLEDAVVRARAAGLSLHTAPNSPSLCPPICHSLLWPLGGRRIGRLTLSSDRETLGVQLNPSPLSLGRRSTSPVRSDAAISSGLRLYFAAARRTLWRAPTFAASSVPPRAAPTCRRCISQHERGRSTAACCCCSATRLPRVATRTGARR